MEIVQNVPLQNLKALKHYLYVQCTNNYIKTTTSQKCIIHYQN